MEEKCQFYSGPGYRLAAVVTLPESHRSTQQNPAIVLCQGYAGLKEAVLPAVAAHLAGAGYLVLRFDYRGFGESEGPRFRLIPLEQIEDIRNAITYMVTRDDVDPERVGLWGTSFGGAHAPYVASVDHRVKCIVSNLGVGNGERWLHCLRREWEWQAFLSELREDRLVRVVSGQSRRVHPYHIMETTPEGWKFWEDSLKINPERGNTELPLEVADAILEYKPEAVAHAMKSPALYISAALDCLTPIREQLSLYENSPDPKRHVVLLEADHHAVYQEPHFTRLMDISTAWFKEYLPA